MIASRVLSAPRIRLGVQSLALALLMATITTLGVKVFGWKWHPARAPAAQVATRDLSHDQRLIAVTNEPTASASPMPSAPRSAGSAENRHLSAGEMFAAATAARSRGNTAEALRLSLQIEEYFPNSDEGIRAHLLLGVLYLAQQRPEPALQEFATFRRVGLPDQKAEAYWGQAQALRLLGRAQDEQIVLEELIQSYPRSAYVSAARIRLHELAPDAAGG